MAKTLSLPTFSIPGSAQALIRPMLFAALGLHALLLFVPFPSERKEKVPEQKEAPVKITQLATTKAAGKPLPKLATPKLAKPPLPKIARPVNGSVVERTNQPKPIEAPQPQEATPTPIQPAKGQQVEQSSGGEVSDLLKVFQSIVFPAAQENCFDKGFPYCYIANAGLAQVTSHYEKEMPAKKVTFEPVASDTNKKLYKVSNGKETQYLSLFTDGSTTVINLAREQIASLETLKGAATVPSAYAEVIGQVFQDGADRSLGDVTGVTPAKFAQPELFYSELGGTDGSGYEIVAETKPTVATMASLTGADPSAISSDLKARLASKNLQVQEIGQYGGGKVYQVKAGSNTVYLNLVPTKDGSGTIAVTWLANPG